MDPDDGGSKLVPQEHAVGNANAQQPSGEQQQDHGKLTMPIKESLQSHESTGELQTSVQEPPTTTGSQESMTSQTISVDNPDKSGTAQQVDHNVMPEQANHTDLTPQLSTELPNDQLVDGETHEPPSTDNDNNRRTDDSDPTVLGQDGNEHKQSMVQSKNVPEADMPQHKEPQHTRCPSESVRDGKSKSDGNAAVRLQEAHRLSADEDDGRMSVCEEDAGDSGTTDVGEEDGGDDVGEEGDDDVAEIQSRLKLGVAKARSKLTQRHEPFEEDMKLEALRQEYRNRESTGQPHIKYEPGFGGYGEMHHAQQPYGGFDPRSFGALAVPGYRNTMHLGEMNSPYAPRYHLAEHEAPSATGSYAQGHMRVPPGTSMVHPYRTNATAASQGYTSHRQHMMSRQAAHYHTQPYGQTPPQPGYDHFPMSPYELQARPPVPPPSAHWPLAPQAVPAHRNLTQRATPRSRVVEESDGTDDDEPLRTRVPRHRSVVSDSVDSSSAVVQEPEGSGKQAQHDRESDSDFVPPKPVAKMGFKATKVTNAPKTKTAKTMIPEQPPQPQPTQTTPSKSETVDLTASNSPIDWKLPKFDATFEPAQNVNEPSIAKISIPGIYREEILLSTDHGEQETDLLLNIFMPAQKALTIPDPHPATAILNFHTIALMVIEAFVQFEIGDEWGTGRGHWHNDYDHGDVEYQRLRDAKDADPDEIFFAVIDRWRAGVESHKESLHLIRGVQEFCDVALDVIYYIKENGLLKQRKHAARSDKGVKKGARKVGEDEDGKPVKRGAGKVHSPQVTKKAKVEKTKEKAKPKQRGKPRVSGVTVIRR
jgi:hypothetical protein